MLSKIPKGSQWVWRRNSKSFSTIIGCVWRFLKNVLEAYSDQNAETASLPLTICNGWRQRIGLFSGWWAQIVCTWKGFICFLVLNDSPHDKLCRIGVSQRIGIFFLFWPFHNLVMFSRLLCNFHNLNALGTDIVSLMVYCTRFSYLE